MKILLIGTGLLSLLIAAIFAAEVKRNPFAGTWRWTFTMPDGTKAEPKVRLKEQDGQLVGKSSFRAGTETAITNITVQGDALKFDVVRERNGQQIVTHYSGRVSGDTLKGQIRSNWTGEEQTYPWEAQRFSGIEGTWKWSFDYGVFKPEYRTKLKLDGNRVSGKINSGRRELDIKHGRFVKDTITFRVEAEREGVKYTNYYFGKVDGDVIEGRMETVLLGESITNDWSATRLE